MRLSRFFITWTFVSARGQRRRRRCHPRGRRSRESGPIREAVVMGRSAFDNAGASGYGPAKNRARTLTDADFSDRRVAQPWLKLAALMLVVAALGLPINDLFRYAPLVIATVVVVTGTVGTRVAPWLAALAVLVLCMLGQLLFPAPRIEEGHNVFLLDDTRENLSAHSRGRTDGEGFASGLPREVFRHMAAEFDATYPRERSEE